MKDIKKQNKALDIYHCHDLSRNRCVVTLEQEKAIYYVFSKVNPFSKNPIYLRLSKKDFFEKLGIVGDDKYVRYKDLMKAMVQKSLGEIRDENKEAIVSTFMKIEGDNRKSYFEVYLNPLFMPYLENLIKYTKLSFSEIVKLDTKNSFDLYRGIRSGTFSNKRLNSRYETVEYFRKFLGSKNQYLKNKDFERGVLKPSIKKIKEKTSLNIDYEKIKVSNIDCYKFIGKNLDANKKEIFSLKLSERTGKTVTAEESIKNLLGET